MSLQFQSSLHIIMSGRGKPRKAKTPDSKPANNIQGCKEKREPPPQRCPNFTEEKKEETTETKKARVQKKPNHSDEKPSANSRNSATVETSKQNGVFKDRTKARGAKTRESSAGQNTAEDTGDNSEAVECAGKPLEERAEKPKAQPERLESNTEACGGKAARKLPDLFKKTLTELRKRKVVISETSQVVNEIKDHIIKHLEKTESFKNVGTPLGTGSYYENVKISAPDEFDVMVPILVERAKVEPFGDDGAFYSVSLKRGNNPLRKFQQEDVLSGCEMLKEFREEVKKCVKRFTEWSIDKKKRGCPAVTLSRTVGSINISLDVVLSLEVKSNWPPFTSDGLKIEKWLGAKVKQEYKRKPYYLVPKYEGNGKKEKEGVFAKDVWRISFSHIEKAMLTSHGSEKTCCEGRGPKCCRKDCLKLLKHLLHLLKEKNSSNFDKFCSYHAKTTFLHACSSRPKDSDWLASDLSSCFQQLLQDFGDGLKRGEIFNFFIPSQNLLFGLSTKRCNELADCIAEQCEQGFPIFEELRK